MTSGTMLMVVFQVILRVSGREVWNPDFWAYLKNNIYICSLLCPLGSKAECFSQFPAIRT